MSLSTFVTASQLLSSAATSHQQRVQAEQTIRLHFLHARPVESSLHVLIEVCVSPASTTEEAKLLALVTLRDIFLQRHSEVELKRLSDDVVNRLLSMLVNKDAAATTNGAFERSLRQVTAVLCKLQLLNHAADQIRSPATGLGALMGGLASHDTLPAVRQTAAIKLLREVIGELSAPHGGLSLEIHESCHRAFEVSLLEPALNAAVLRVHKISHVITVQSPHRGISQMRERLVPLLTESLWLLHGIAAWDYRWHGNPNVTSKLAKLRPPAAWNSILLQQNLLGLVLRLFASLRNDAGISEACKAFFSGLCRS